MKVNLYVLNDVSRDSRVLREASALAAAGHEVTVIGTTADPDQPTGTRESRDGFTILRVALHRRWPFWFVWLRHPWRLSRRLRSEVSGGVRSGPGRWPRAAAALALAIVSLPWVAIRGAIHGAERAVLRRPPRRTWFDYLLWWRSFVLGWSRAAVGLAPIADVHHANDMETLPAAVTAARLHGGRVVYDSHEVFLEWGETRRQSRIVRAIIARWERRLARKAVALVTIDEGVAAELRRRLQPRQVVILHNTPPRWAPPAVPRDLLRDAAGIAPGVPVVLCHGGFQADRGLEQTAEAMLRPGLEKAHLVFLGYRTRFLEPIVASFPDPARIHVLPAVDPAELLDWVAGADVDVMATQPSELNNLISAPNKLFESLASGVPVVSSDFPVRRRILIDDPDGPLGAVCDPTDPAAIASAIRSILDLDPEGRADLRRRCLRAAHERWNWETESVKLVELYASLAVQPA